MDERMKLVSAVVIVLSLIAINAISAHTSEPTFTRGSVRFAKHKAEVAPYEFEAYKNNAQPTGYELHCTKCPFLKAYKPTTMQKQAMDAGAVIEISSDEPL